MCPEAPRRSLSIYDETAAVRSDILFIKEDSALLLRLLAAVYKFIIDIKQAAE